MRQPGDNSAVTSPLNEQMMVVAERSRPTSKLELPQYLYSEAEGGGMLPSF